MSIQPVFMPDAETFLVGSVFLIPTLVGFILGARSWGSDSARTPEGGDTGCESRQSHPPSPSPAASSRDAAPPLYLQSLSDGRTRRNSDDPPLPPPSPPAAHESGEETSPCPMCPPSSAPLPPLLGIAFTHFTGLLFSCSVPYRAGPHGFHKFVAGSPAFYFFVPTSLLMLAVAVPIISRARWYALLCLIIRAFPILHLTDVVYRGQACLEKDRYAGISALCIAPLVLATHWAMRLSAAEFRHHAYVFAMVPVSIGWRLRASRGLLDAAFRISCLAGMWSFCYLVFAVCGRRRRRNERRSELVVSRGTGRAGGTAILDYWWMIAFIGPVMTMPYWGVAYAVIERVNFFLLKSHNGDVRFILVAVPVSAAIASCARTIETALVGPIADPTIGLLGIGIADERERHARTSASHDPSPASSGHVAHSIKHADDDLAPLRRLGSGVDSAAEHSHTQLNKAAALMVVSRVLLIGIAVVVLRQDGGHDGGQGVLSPQIMRLAAGLFGTLGVLLVLGVDGVGGEGGGSWRTKCWRALLRAFRVAGNFDNANHRQTLSTKSLNHRVRRLRRALQLVLQSNLPVRVALLLLLKFSGDGDGFLWDRRTHGVNPSWYMNILIAAVAADACASGLACAPVAHVFITVACSLTHLAAIPISVVPLCFAFAMHAMIMGVYVGWARRAGQESRSSHLGRAHDAENAHILTASANEERVTVAVEHLGQPHDDADDADDADETAHVQPAPANAEGGGGADVGGQGGKGQGWGRQRLSHQEFIRSLSRAMS